jgi:hypothetical protein
MVFFARPSVLARHPSFLVWNPSWLPSFLSWFSFQLSFRPSFVHGRPRGVSVFVPSCLISVESVKSNPINLVNPIQLMTPVVAFFM